MIGTPKNSEFEAKGDKQILALKQAVEKEYGGNSYSKEVVQLAYGAMINKNISKIIEKEISDRASRRPFLKPESGLHIQQDQDEDEEDDYSETIADQIDVTKSKYEDWIDEVMKKVGADHNKFEDWATYLDLEFVINFMTEQLLTIEDARMEASVAQNPNHLNENLVKEILGFQMKQYKLMIAKYGESLEMMDEMIECIIIKDKIWQNWGVEDEDLYHFIQVTNNPLLVNLQQEFKSFRREILKVLAKKSYN